MDQAKAVKHLSGDPILKKLIKKHPPFNWPKTGDIFIDLVESIINQQLSLASAASIFDRFKTLFENDINPENTLRLKKEQLRAVGLSNSKACYIQNVAQSCLSGKIVQSELAKMPNNKVIAKLTSIKGIGPWSANMILMFSFNRPDVFPVEDLGIRTAMSRLYKLNKEDRAKMVKISQTWSPYRTLASRYLWKSLNNN